jgi:hypothetical protein
MVVQITATQRKQDIGAPITVSQKKIPGHHS